MNMFHRPGAYDAFGQVLMEAMERHPVERLTYCCVPNHCHFVVRTKTNTSLVTR